MSHHYIERCSCGVIIAQCRCPNPDKPEVVLPAGCAACRQTPGDTPPAELQAPRSPLC